MTRTCPPVKSPLLVTPITWTHPSPSTACPVCGPLEVSSSSDPLFSLHTCIIGKCLMSFCLCMCVSMCMCECICDVCTCIWCACVMCACAYVHVCTYVCVHVRACVRGSGSSYLYDLWIGQDRNRPTLRVNCQNLPTPAADVQGLLWPPGLGLWDHHLPRGGKLIVGLGVHDGRHVWDGEEGAFGCHFVHLPAQLVLNSGCVYWSGIETMGMTHRTCQFWQMYFSAGEGGDGQGKGGGRRKGWVGRVKKKAC